MEQRGPRVSFASGTMHASVPLPGTELCNQRRIAINRGAARARARERASEEEKRRGGGARARTPVSSNNVNRRVNGVNARGGQAGVTALSQVKSRLTPLITQI